MMSNSLSDLAYCAGLFDGEGCVLLKKDKDNYALRIKISSTDYPVLDWLKEHFGGSIIVKHKGGDNRRKSWDWYCSSKENMNFMFGILPYLIIKKDQVIESIEYLCSIQEGGKLTEDEIRLRKIYYLKLQELKRA